MRIPKIPGQTGHIFLTQKRVRKQLQIRNKEDATMSEKVVMTSLQFEMVKGYVDSYNKADLVMNVATKEFSEGNPLYDISFNDFLIAVYRPEDVTIEQTVEEKLLYCYAETSSINEDFREGYRAGIQGTLKILNIKVKGINE